MNVQQEKRQKRLRRHRRVRKNVVGTPDTADYKICIPFAEKMPYEDVFVIPAVGNAANAVMASARLGLHTAFVTNIGSDQEGKNCLAEL